jgi:hypothetical protein
MRRMKALAHPAVASPARRHHDALCFASLRTGRLREVILRRSTLDRWTPVPDDPHGLLRVYDQHKLEIQRAVQRRLSLIGDTAVAEVEATDFVDGVVPEDAMDQPLSGLSPIYVPAWS